IINEFRSYFTRDNNQSDPFLLAPSGRVRITSALADGTQGVSLLSFGGNPSFPQNGSNTLIEASNEVSYLTRDRAHRIKLGALFDLNRFDQDVTNNRLGTFTYNSLAAFESNTPDSYTRTRGSQQREGSATSGAVYLGDTWRPSEGVQVVYGLRGEASRVGNAPALNPEIEQLFGFRTNNFPSEVHVSPRIGFSANLSRPDSNDPFSQFRPAFVIRGGVGEFRARTPTGLYTSAQSATGLTDTEQQLACIGAAVPTPDWQSYAVDPNSAPTSCVPGVSVPPSFSANRRAVTLLAPDFEAPRSWRASLGLQHRLFGLFTVAADASYARGVALYGVNDLNLSSTPAFTLAGEGNRPVYAPASAIVPTTGQVSSAASRRFAQYGQVLEFTSGLKSATRQLTLSMNGGTAGGTAINLSYTLQKTRDQSSFTCCSAAQGFASPTTAGDPNVVEWSPGDLDVRHSIQGFLTRPLTSWVDVTAIARLASGTPFTPIVGGDINGDGARNDRAFLFDPANAADPAVASAIQGLLASAPSRVRDCLTAQLGQVAGRNSCRGPWTPSLDLQANFRPSGFNLNRKMMFSLIGSNVLAGLDQLFHGSDLHGWGQFNRADPTLLYVRGFNQATQSFVYDVNGRFGSNSASRSAYRQPFVLALQARLTLGPDPRDRFRQIFAARTDSSTLAAAAVMNPITQIVQMRDTLKLTDDQVAKLTVISDTLAARAQAVAMAIRAEVQKKGAGDPQAIMAIIRPRIVEGRQALTAALTGAKSILTPEQWTQVPDSIKTPRGLGGFGGRQGEGGRGGRERN
ncbi:MAG: Spy/CpxP family protein refolding chaperone, partial [Gemmatimonadaceae bacterium]